MGMKIVLEADEEVGKYRQFWENSNIQEEAKYMLFNKCTSQAVLYGLSCLQVNTNEGRWTSFFFLNTHKEGHSLVFSSGTVIPKNFYL